MLCAPEFLQRSLCVCKSYLVGNQGRKGRPGSCPLVLCPGLGDPLGAEEGTETRVPTLLIRCGLVLAWWCVY